FSRAFHIVFAGGRVGGTAVAFVDHHFLAVMRPSFDERVAAKDFFNLVCRRCVQAQELNIMTRISFVNRDDIGGVIIEGGEPFFFLFFRPVVLRGRDVVIRLVGAFLEGTGRV